MKAIISRIFGFFKHLFLRLRVVVTLHIGQEKVKDQVQNEDAQKGDTNDR